MSIRFKTLLIVIISGVGLFFINIALSHSIILPKFIEIENDRALMNLDRVSEAFNREKDFLSSKSKDWAYWDDSYKFIIDKNQAYIDSNITDESLDNLLIDFMIFTNEKGKTIYSKVIDSATFKIEDLQDIFYFQEENELVGLTKTTLGPLLFVSQPIMNSLGEGPSRGRLVFGKYFDDNKIIELSKTTKLNLEFKNVNNNFGANEKIRINGDKIETFSVYEDYKGKPALLLKVTQPRDIYNQGFTATTYFIVTSGIGGLISMIIFFIASEFLIVSAFKKATLDLESERIKFTSFMDNIPNVAWMKDPTTWEHIYINKAFESFFKKTLKEIEGKTDYNFWPKEVADNLRKHDEEVLKKGLSIKSYEDVPGPDRVLHHWLVYKFPLISNGKTLIAGIATDITDHKKHEQQLVDKSNELEKINQLMVGRELKMVELKNEIKKLKGGEK